MVSLIWEKKPSFQIEKRHSHLGFCQAKFHIRSQIHNQHRGCKLKPTTEYGQICTQRKQSSGKNPSRKNLPSSHQDPQDCFSHPQYPVVKYSTASFIS